MCLVRCLLHFVCCLLLVGRRLGFVVYGLLLQLLMFIGCRCCGLYVVFSLSLKDCSLLFVVCCCIDCCLLFACLHVVCCTLSVVCSSLFVGRCSMFVVCCWLFVVVVVC